MTQPKTLTDAIKFFAVPAHCREYLVARRWPAGVKCPACGSTSVYFDNLAVGVVGLAPPSIFASEGDLYQDTFNTAPFLGNDNFNTPNGDSLSVRLSASRAHLRGFGKPMGARR